ncbi:MAG: hypothetical protein ACOY46_12570, partial [Bacillota bacterium]
MGNYVLAYTEDINSRNPESRSQTYMPYKRHHREMKIILNAFNARLKKPQRTQRTQSFLACL